MSRRFQTPRVIITGRGAHEEIKNLPVLDGKKRSLVICDSKRVDTEVEAKIKHDLTALGIEVIEFREVSELVTSSQLQSGDKIVKESNFDLIISIGGRAAIQLGKLLALLATNPHDGETLLGLEKLNKPPLTMIAVAMTAGSGAAISHCACFNQSESHCRCAFSNQNLMPDVAVLDPGLSAWQAPNEIAADGLTSLAYAIESLLSGKGTPVTETCARAAISAIIHWLPKAYTHGNDIDAREELMYAQQMVSMAIFNTAPSQLCMMAGQIEASLRIPFGNSVAALLPYLLDFYTTVSPERVERVGAAIWEAEQQILESERKLTPSEMVSRFIQRLDMPQKLSFLGMDEEHIETIMTTLPSSHIGGEIVEDLDPEAMKGILQRAL